MKVIVLLVVMVSTGLLLTGDYLMKYATMVKNPIVFLLLAAGVWAISIPGWYWVLRIEKFAWTGMVLSMMSIIGSILIGLLIFHEKLSMTEWMGLGFALLSLFLLSNKA